MLNSQHILYRGSHRLFSFTPNNRLPRVVPRHELRRPHTPSIRHGSAHESNRPSTTSFAASIRPPTVGRQLLFFVLGSVAVFGLAAKQTNEDTYQWTKKLSSYGLSFKIRPPSNEEMRKASYRELGRRLQARLTQFQEAVSGLPQDIRAMAVYSYAQVAQSILNTTEGSRMCYAIGALNGAILLAWQIPRLTPVMMRAFTHSPLSGLSYTMLTCVFSHSSFLHYLFNTMALASFGSAATSYLTTKQQEPGHLRESTSKWHFLAFFVSAGLFSSAVSHVITARITYPQLVSRLTRLAPSLTSGTFSSASTAARSSTAAAEIASTIKPSLGASGAIYATVTLTAMAYPDTHITLIFPPTPPIPIQYGVFGLMAVDVLGILRGWKLFDHYAHLGGALFGIWYHAYGPQIWESFRVMTLGSLPPSLYP